MAGFGGDVECEETPRRTFSLDIDTGRTEIGKMPPVRAAVQLNMEGATRMHSVLLVMPRRQSAVWGNGSQPPLQYL